MFGLGKNKSNAVKKPSFFLFATESGRAIAEYGLYRIGHHFMDKSNQGKGHPVLVIPGFMASDWSTGPLRRFLDDLGYNSYTWDLGRNYGSPNYVQALHDRLKAIQSENQEKVTLVGWSLGGVYAREVARDFPDLVQQVITLGSPFAGLTKKNNVAWLYKLISGNEVSDINPEFLDRLKEPPPVPVTAIYTKGDGIVSWEHCMEKEAEEYPLVQNIEVYGSHCGLGHNLAVLKLIANRLNQQGEWKPFSPDWLQTYLYPNLA